ncbi:MAG: DUF2892 domain-containing protein [Halobacteriales archaeon]
MDKNVGGLDRSARLVVGAVLLIAGLAAYAEYLQLGTGLAVAGVVVGAVLLVTGLSQRCLVHRLVGIDTFRR